MRKVKWLIFILLLVLTFGFINTWANHQTVIDQTYNFDQQMDISHLGKAESKELVDLDWTEQDLIDDQFIKVGQTEELSLYLKRNILNIAIVDHKSDYVWFGYYPKYKEKTYTDSVRSLIESGVTIDYIDSTSLNEASMSVSNIKAGTLIDYEYVDNGFIADINMVKLGISFQLKVNLIEDKVQVEVPSDSIVEVPYQTAAMKFPKEYKLLSVMAFPYLGSENYEINAYALVPDGSGALIRYQDIPYASAYIRRVFGRDLGIQTQVTSMNHLKTESPVSLPIFGINHGYQQAAFIAEVHSGFGAVELHAYPYAYNNVHINRTFFKYLVRDKSLIKLSGGDISSITIINKDPYPESYKVTYDFLSNEQASYSGMAKRYRENLGLTQEIKDDTIDLHMEVIGLDYKPSLIGKTHVKLTTYDDLLQMTKEILESVDQIDVTYRSYNRNGLYGRQPNDFSIASQLGGKKDFRELTDYAAETDKVNLSLYHDPMISPQQKLFGTYLKRTTLELFTVPIESSMIDVGYLLPVISTANRILNNQKDFEKYNIESLSLNSIGQMSFSYQGKDDVIYREEMIKQLTEEIDQLNDYYLGLYRPNSYLFENITSYYDMMHQSNLYGFMTDQVPFIPMVLSGHIKLYGPYINYVSDIDTMILKMIEYNLRPSFMITQAEGHLLRHTNHEYLFTTEFDLWKEMMIDTYQKVSPYLNKVTSAHMISHTYIEDTLVEITYDNDIKIYVNYGMVDISYNDLVIPALSASFKEGTA